MVKKQKEFTNRKRSQQLESFTINFIKISQKKKVFSSQRNFLFLTLSIDKTKTGQALDSLNLFYLMDRDSIELLYYYGMRYEK